MSIIKTTLNLPYLDEGEEVFIEFGKYVDGTPAIEIFSETEGPVATATVNLSGYNISPAPGHVIIKDYSENEGMVEALIAAGIITERGEGFSFGFITNGAFECPIAEEHLDKL